MANMDLYDYVYYRPPGTRHYRIVNPLTGKVFDTTTLSMVLPADLSDYEDANVALTRVANLNGFPVDLPLDKLDPGEYDLLFFEGAAATTTAEPAAGVEFGASFKWSGKQMYAPKQKLSDRVK